MINATNLFERRSVQVTGSFSNPDIIESLQKINTNLTVAKNLIQKTNEAEKKRADLEKKKKESDKRKEEERKQEEVKSQKKSLSLTSPSLPNIGFLDGIKNFLTFAILGYGALRLKKYLPAILDTAKKITPLISTVEDIVGTLFNGVVSGIDNGYKAYDKLRALSKSIGGENYEKTFDEFSDKLKVFVNTAVVVGLTIAASGAFGGGKGKGKGPRGRGGPAGRPQGPSGGPGVTQGGQGARRGPLTQRPTVTQGGRGVNRNPFRSAANVTEGIGDDLAARGARGALGNAGKFAGRAAPFIGPLIDFGVRLYLGDPVGRATSAAIGNLAGQSIGSWIGGAIGGIAGSVVPILGTALGGSVGVVIGGLIGAGLGSWLGESLYDMVAGAKPVKIERKASGGIVGGKTVSSRTIRKAPKRPKKSQSNKSIPGVSVGGQKKIEELFSNPKESKVKNQSRSLTSSARTLKKIPLLGGIMGASIDVAQGQQMDKNIIKNFSNNLGILIDNLVNDQVAMTTGDIQNSIYSMAGGGSVPSTRTLNAGRSVGERFSDAMYRTLDIASRIRTEEVLRDIRKELMLKSPSGGETFNPDEVPGGLSVTSDSEDFWLLATAALFENSDPQGAADVAQAIYNRVAMPGDPWHTGGSIRKTILNPNQFQPVRDYGGASIWNNIKDKQSAISFIKKYGKSQEQLESVASALLDTNRQRSARTFVGPRDSFRSVSYEKSNNHLADDTEVDRAGHVFGFEPRGATIGAFRAGKLTAAEINKSVSGEVEYLVGTKGEIFPLPKGNPQFNTTEGYMGGTFTSTRGGGRQHKGQDIGVDPGSPVLAMKSGVVEDIYRNYGGVGDAVVVRYADGQTGIYGHVNPSVKINAKVNAGQKIATIFNEGTNSHLHYMRRLANGNYVNPLPILKNLKSSTQIANKPNPNKSQSPTSQGKVIRSINLKAGNVLIEREGGKFTLNGNPVSEDLVKAYKKNHPAAFGETSAIPTASFTPIASTTPSAAPGIAKVSDSKAAEIAYADNTTRETVLQTVIVNNNNTQFVPVPTRSSQYTFA